MTGIAPSFASSSLITNKEVPIPVPGKKKNTTPHSPDSTPVQPRPVLPDQQQFQQHLRDLARAAIRVVLEDVMREELDAIIGVGWGESSRQQQRVSQRLLLPRPSYNDGPH